MLPLVRFLTPDVAAALPRRWVGPGVKLPRTRFSRIPTSANGRCLFIWNHWIDVPSSHREMRCPHVALCTQAPVIVTGTAADHAGKLPRIVTERHYWSLAGS